MKIIAHHKNKHSWSLRPNSMGQIETGMQHYGSKTHEIPIPIFTAKLQYAGHYQGTRSIVVQFRGDDADSLIAVLQGVGACEYDMDKDDGFVMMEHLIKRDDPFFTYYDEGWFEGVFTFKKKGNRIFITPFRGDVSKEVPVN